MKLKDVELLAPAGDMEGLRAALRYGADALYCGGPFMQMRAEKAGFSEKELEEASKEVHDRGKKLYVTVNCFAEDEDIIRIGEYGRFLHHIGVDAAIVSDIGAIAELKDKCPDLEIHLSTQANCMNHRSAAVYRDMGVRRIVLARELSIRQIARLRALTPPDLELEAFVHGAMCMSYSGRCLLSSYMTGRSANKGECAHSCRWNYYLVEEKRPGEYFKIEEDEKGTAILSSKELCAVDLLEDLAKAGICAFKIEGRMKTPFYSATVVNAYRMAMDGSAPAEAIKRELNTVSHRPFSTGFYLSDPDAVAPDTEGYIRDWLFAGTAAEDSREGFATIETRNPFAAGDVLEVLSPGRPGRPFTLSSIVDEDGCALQRSAVPMRRLKINAPDGVRRGDIIRKEVQQTK